MPRPAGPSRHRGGRRCAPNRDSHPELAPGAAYVFTGKSGTWTQIAELAVSGTAELGTSPAISTDGSTIMLGSPASNNDNWEAFVFTKSGITYVQTLVRAVDAIPGRYR